jgi:pyruvate/2-oxoglutarate dehydrogenase complex dihydrolipoamide acyltransferase (E2) component
VTHTIIVTNRIVLERPSTNTIEISRQLDFLRQQGSNISAGLAALTTNTPPAMMSGAQPATTHEARSASTKADPQPHLALPPLVTRSEELRQVDTVTASGTPPAPAISATAVSKAAVPPSTSAQQTAIPGNTGRPDQPPIQPAQIAELVLGGTVLLGLAALLFFGLTAYARKRPMRMVAGVNFRARPPSSSSRCSSWWQLHSPR